VGSADADGSHGKIMATASAVARAQATIALENECFIGSRKALGQTTNGIAAGSTLPT